MLKWSYRPRDSPRMRPRGPAAAGRSRYSEFDKKIPNAIIHIGLRDEKRGIAAAVTPLLTNI